MNYVFLDIEWIQENNKFNIYKNEIIELCLLSVKVCEYEYSKKYFSMVKISDNSKYKSFQLSHIKESDIERSKPLHKVIETVIKTVEDDDIIVVWSRETFILLQHAIHKCDFNKLQNKVIYLQDITTLAKNDRSKPIGFAHSLDKFKIKYDKNYLHDSRYDVEYLYRLFNEIRNRIKKCIPIDYFESNFVITKDGMIHNIKCEDTKDIISSDKQYATIENMFDGHAICKKCIDNFPKIRKPIDIRSCHASLQLRDDMVYEMCQSFGLQCTISEGVIFVKGIYTRWKIIHDGEKILSLQHENYRKKFNKSNQKGRKMKFDDYHEQKNVSLKNLHHVLRYIKIHEDNFLNEEKQKTHIERLIDSVKM